MNRRIAKKVSTKARHLLGNYSTQQMEQAHRIYPVVDGSDSPVVRRAERKARRQRRDAHYWHRRWYRPPPRTP